MSSQPRSRVDRRKEETRARILEAAVELFAEVGFEATKIADVCERADVARQTFFNHFATKQDVAQELARRGHDFFLEAIEIARREGSDTGERLALLFASIHQAASQVGPMHVDLVTEVARASYEKTDPAQIGSLQRGVEKLLRAGRAQGDVSRRHPLEDQAALVLGALQNLTFEWTHRADFPIAERSARMARMLAEVLAP